MTYHIAICDNDSRDAGYVSELLHHWAQLRGCAVTEERFPSAEGFLFRYEEDRSFVLQKCSLKLILRIHIQMVRRLVEKKNIWGPAASRIQGTGQKNVRLLRALSPEARSCRDRRVRGSADGAHSDRPARRCWTPPGSSPGPAPGTAGR